MPIACAQVSRGPGAQNSVKGGNQEAQMFTVGGPLLQITVLEAESEHVYLNCKVLGFNNGLLQVKHADGQVVMYNTRSPKFVKAVEQK
jgi:hypothetical protein